MFNIVKDTFIPHKNNGYKPHVFRERGVAVLLAITLLFGLLSLGGTLIVTRTNLVAAIQAAFLVDLTNETRADEGLHALRTNPLLIQAAQAKANDMAAKSYFSHTSPNGDKPWNFISATGYQFTYAGENLAINFIDSEKVHEAWLRSTTHKKNILHDKFTEIGIASARGSYNGRPAVFVVQMFGRPQVATAYQPLTTTTTLTSNTNIAPDVSSWVSGNYLANLDSKQGFTNGDQVFITAQALNVRQAPYGRVIDTAKRYDIGTIVDGPRFVRGITWWNVDFDNAGGQQLLARLDSARVQGETIAVTDVVDDGNTIVATADESLSAPIPATTKESGWCLCKKLFTNPAKLSAMLFAGMSLLLAILLAILVGVNYKKQHAKSIFYGVSLFVLLLLLAYYYTAAGGLGMIL